MEEVFIYGAASVSTGLMIIGRYLFMPRTTREYIGKFTLGLGAALTIFGVALIGANYSSLDQEQPPSQLEQTIEKNPWPSEDGSQHFIPTGSLINEY